MGLSEAERVLNGVFASAREPSKTAGIVEK